MEGLVSLIWIVTLTAIPGIYLVPERFKSIFTIVAILTISLVSSLLAFPALTGHPSELVLNGGNLLGDISFRIDGLASWFILVINFTVITGVIYGAGYMKSYVNQPFKLSLHWSLFVLFHSSMLWVVMLQSTLAFLIAWELMSLSSMLLVIFDHNNIRTLKAGLNYLVQMHISIVFLTIGFIWVYSESGSLSFEAIRLFFQSNDNLWLFLIFFTGFGLKAGFVPLHTWLPLAHPAAPSHISGVMSGVIVKLGIYGIIRIIGFLSSDFLLLGKIVLSISLLTGLFGILNAAVHRDFKRMLAYCTIENIGIIGIGIGVGLIGSGLGSPVLYFLGFGGALLHVLNHSLFKSLLFFSAGSVYQQMHIRNMDRLGGLIKYMPQTAAIFLVGAIAIGGIPPFNGFVSEYIIYIGLIEGIKSDNLSLIMLFILSLAGLSIIGGLSVMTFTKSFGTIFLGSARGSEVNKPHEVGYLMLIPQYIIISVMLSIALFPGFYLDKLNYVLPGLTNAMITPGTLISGLSTDLFIIGFSAMGFILLISMIWLIRNRIQRHRYTQPDATWGCGYIAPDSRMQYTGKSFSKPLGKIFNFLLIERKRFDELNPGEIFPADRKYKSNYHDFFESRFINIITRRLAYAASWFSFVQNGRIQSYVLYGIVFILAMLILTVFNFI